MEPENATWGAIEQAISQEVWGNENKSLAETLQASLQLNQAKGALSNLDNINNTKTLPKPTKNFLSQLSTILTTPSNPPITDEIITRVGFALAFLNQYPLSTIDLTKTTQDKSGKYQLTLKDQRKVNVTFENNLVKIVS